MVRILSTLGVIVMLVADMAHPRRSAETLATLIAGGTLETPRLTFDQFSYTQGTGPPAASAINLSSIDNGDGWQGLTINGTFNITAVFSQSTIHYRVTAKSGGVTYAASLSGNPVAGAGGLSTVNENFSGGLSPLTIFSQNGSTQTEDSTTFASPRPSLTSDSILRLSGTPASPSTLSFLQQTYRATAFQADFDLDDDVDGNDFLIWQRGLGATGSNLRIQGDANSDGAIDNSDLTIWRDSFGAPLPLLQSIPEPSGVVLALVGMCCMAPPKAPNAV